MRRLLCGVVLVAALVAPAQGRQDSSGGLAWRRMSQAEKTWYALGYHRGRQYAGEALQSTLAAVGDHIQDGDSFLALIKVFQDVSVRSVDAHQLVEQLDLLFQDRANLPISISEMMEVAVQRLKGESVEETLKALRKKAGERGEAE